jgi:hypothetical protein
MKNLRSTASFHTSRSILLTALLALGAAACKSSSSDNSSSASSSKSPEAASQSAGRVDLSNDLSTTAQVTAVDTVDRMITLRREDGKLFTVQAGPEVRNFNQIAAGDTLRVRYHESLSASKRPAGESVGAVAAAAGARAAPGQTPAGGVAVGASVRVKIESIDHANSIVVFSLPGGELSTVRAQRREGQEFVKGLKVGDIVQLDYTAALALAIEKL